MNKNIENALQYIRNTDGNATLENFIEDHDPVGELLWRDIKSYVRIIGGKLFVAEDTKNDL